MSQNSKKTIKSLDKLATAMLPEVDSEWGKDTLEMALLELQEAPEVTLMAQIVAVEEEKAKKEKEIARKRKELEEATTEVSGFQRALMRMEAGFKNALMSDPNITMMRKRWGDFFNNMIEKLLEDAKKSDKRYKKISSDLRKTMKNAQAIEKAIEASRKTADEFDKSRGELESNLNALLGKE